ncbi:MAG: hypothetical protein ACI875_002045 [Planctomycetota bacterium]|jgi:hypothetical protein
MASLVKTKTGFRAMVAVKGNRATKCFKTKIEAKDWAIHKEVEFKNQVGQVTKISFSDVKRGAIMGHGSGCISQL